MPPKNFVKYTILTYRKDKYSFTMADAIPIGYLKAFSYDFFDELRNKLLETDDLYNFKFLIPASDPFGGFNFFAKFLENFHGNKKDIDDIYDKYMNIAKHTCPRCGKRRMLLGEKFLCDDCRKRTGFEIYDVDASTNLHFHEMVKYPYDFIVDDKRSKSDNQKLIENLPFFMPDRKTIDIILGKNKEYDYSFTALDFMPVDFLRRHGIHFIEDIDFELMKNNNENKCHFGVNEKNKSTLDGCYIIFDDDFNGGEDVKNKINEILKRYYNKEKEMRRKYRISLIDKFLKFMKM